MAAIEPVELTLSFGIGTRERTFASLDDLDTWFQAEQQAWSYLSELKSGDAAARSIVSQYTSHWANTRSQITRARSTEDVNARSASLREVRSAFESGSLFLAESPRGRFVQSLFTSRPAIGAHALALFAKLGAGISTPAGVEGAFRAVAFDYGIGEEADHYRVSIEALIAGAQEHLQSAGVRLASAEEKARSFSAELSLRLANSEQALDAKMKSADERLAALEGTYDQKLALRSPVEYWDRAAKSHNQNASLLAAAATLAIGGFTFAAYRLAPAILGVSERPTNWQLGLVVVGFTFAIWIVRLIVRLFLSQVHLATSARERVTMATVYLSLMRENLGPRDEDRSQILEVLFRPTATGIVRDDSAPPSLIEFLSRGK